MKKFGMIDHINMREAFETELKFSQHLNEHIDLLSNELGIDLTKGETEVPIGMYRCDVTTGLVVIENQFGKSDHNHIGKLLTYFANRDVKVGILICEETTVEHMRTFQWLNEHRNEDEYFYLITARVIFIGESDLAIDLKVHVGPEFPKPDKDRKKFRFTPMLTELRNRFEELKPEARISPPANALKIRTGKSDLHFEWNPKGPHRDKVLEVGLHIETKDEKFNKCIMEHLRTFKNELEQRLSEEIYYGPWGETERLSKRMRISVERGFKFKDQSDEEFIEWAVQTMLVMYETLMPSLKEKL